MANRFNEAVRYEKDGVTKFAAAPSEKALLEFSGWKKVEKAVRAKSSTKKAATEHEGENK